MSNRPPHGPLLLALRMLEVLKRKRMTRDELAIEFGISAARVWVVLRPMVDAGLVLEERLCHGHDDARWRWNYSVARDWFKKP